MAQKKTAVGSKAPREVAFYYPGPVWHIGDWVKNLILFFDGIAVLVPDYIKDKPLTSDPSIAAGLEREGLLHILSPEKLVDGAATERLAAAMGKVIESGALDPLSKEDTPFHELSNSRLGYGGDPHLADALFKELKARNLAKDTKDGVSIPMHPMVRALILVLLAQILRPCGPQLGFELSPATDRFKVVDGLHALLSLPTVPSSGHVVSLDLQTVGADLGPVPIDEVLSFRREHLAEHRAYARAIRRFVEQLSLLPERSRAKALRDRQEEISDIAESLRRVSRTQWKRPAYFGLTVLGAAWSLKTGNPLGAILGAGASLLSPPTVGPELTGSYSYLFKAAGHFA